MTEIIFDELYRAAGAIILYLFGAFLIYLSIALFYEVTGSDSKEQAFLDRINKFYNKKSILVGSTIIYVASLLLWPLANLYKPIIIINTKEFDKLFGAGVKILLSPIALIIYGVLVACGVIYGILCVRKYNKADKGE